MPRDDDHPRDIPESRLRAILRRAIELDQVTPSRINVKELYEIAAEVGITQSALEEAIRETQEREASRRRSARRMRTIRRAVTGVAAAVFGAVTKFIPLMATSTPPGFTLSAIAPPTLLAMGLAVYSRFRGDQKTFLKDNTGLWLGFGIGWILIGPRGLADLLLPIVSWGVTAVLGYFIVGTGRHEPPGPANVESTLDQLIGSKSSSDQADGGKFGEGHFPFVQEWVVTRIVQSRLGRA